MIGRKPQILNVSCQPTKIEQAAISRLQPYAKHSRAYSRNDVEKVARSLQQYGWTVPLLVSDDDASGNLLIVTGFRRFLAAQLLGLTEVPVIRLSGLTQTQLRAYRLADNRLAQDGGYDSDALAGELSALIDLGFDVLDTGFEMVEVDEILHEAHAASLHNADGAENEIPAFSGPAVTRPDDVWHLGGRHTLLCGDATKPESFAKILTKQAGLVISDPPYNVPINGHVSGKGRRRHREFAMGVGEMSDEAYTEFLRLTHSNVASSCRDGTIAFVFMDWRHLPELFAAGKSVFSELKNLIVWKKTNAGMGTFYRSQHELIAVYKVGSAPHINNFGLGGTGRSRSNVWSYAGVNAFGRNRAEELGMHPTVKPVALIADAIRDCSNRGDIVLDPFGGSGTTLIAAHQTGRRARLIEYDRLYCDVILRRFRKFTGQQPVLAENGQVFDAVEAERSTQARETES